MRNTLIRLIKVLVVLLGVSILGEAYASDYDVVTELGRANGFKPTKRIIKAIVDAARLYQIDVSELTAIAIVETGLGKYAVNRLNKNGTIDKGLFQINTVNEGSCKAFNLDTEEGSALCAAKLLYRIKKNHADYLGRYHSKTPSLKNKYMTKVTTVINAVSRGIE
jgi:hypothetical protein